MTVKRDTYSGLNILANHSGTWGTVCCSRCRFIIDTRRRQAFPQRPAFSHAAWLSRHKPQPLPREDAWRAHWAGRQTYHGLVSSSSVCVARGISRPSPLPPNCPHTQDLLETIQSWWTMICYIAIPLQWVDKWEHKTGHDSVHPHLYLPQVLTPGYTPDCRAGRH